MKTEDCSLSERLCFFVSPNELFKLIITPVSRVRLVVKEPVGRKNELFLM